MDVNVRDSTGETPLHWAAYKDAGEVVMDVGVIGVIAQGPFQRGDCQIALARLGQHAAEVRPGLDVVLVQFDGHIITLPRAGRVTLAIEEFGHLETDFRLGAELSKQSPSPHPKNQLLLQPQLGSSTIQFTGDPAMGRKVSCVVAIQQVQFDSTDLDLPGTQPDRSA